MRACTPVRPCSHTCTNPCQRASALPHRASSRCLLARRQPSCSLAAAGVMLRTLCLPALHCLPSHTACPFTACPAPSPHLHPGPLLHVPRLKPTPRRVSQPPACFSGIVHSGHGSGLLPSCCRPVMLRIQPDPSNHAPGVALQATQATPTTRSSMLETRRRRPLPRPPLPCPQVRAVSACSPERRGPGLAQLLVHGPKVVRCELRFCGAVQSHHKLEYTLSAEVLSHCVRAGRCAT